MIPADDVDDDDMYWWFHNEHDCNRIHQFDLMDASILDAKSDAILPQSSANC